MVCLAPEWNAQRTHKLSKDQTTDTLTDSDRDQGVLLTTGEVALSEQEFEDTSTLCDRLLMQH